MLTPQEVAERAFAKASFGGYNMAMVDEFLDTLTEDYTALYKENAALKAKMKVLVEKVEEYRATEDAMRKTLLTAQTMADELVREAEAKKSSILDDAQQKAAGQIARIQGEVAGEAAKLAAAKKTTEEFIARLRVLYQKELSDLERLQAIIPPSSLRGDEISRTAAEIEESLQSLPTHEDVPPQETVEEAEEKPASDDSTQEAEPVSAGNGRDIDSHTRRIDLDALQFGTQFKM